MSDTWNLLDASVAERARFATAAAVLALPAAPAAPRNAAREVVRLVTQAASCARVATAPVGLFGKQR